MSGYYARLYSMRSVSERPHGWPSPFPPRCRSRPNQPPVATPESGIRTRLRPAARWDCPFVRTGVRPQHTVDHSRRGHRTVAGYQWSHGATPVEGSAESRFLVKGLLDHEDSLPTLVRGPSGRHLESITGNWQGQRPSPRRAVLDRDRRPRRLRRTPLAAGTPPCCHAPQLRTRPRPPSYPLARSRLACSS